MWRFNRLGRSNALPHTSHGKSARSPRVGRALGDDRGIAIGVSIKSPVLQADNDDDDNDDADESPDTDLCSSSPPDVGEIGNITRESNDIDKSNGESVNENWMWTEFLVFFHSIQLYSVKGKEARAKYIERLTTLK